MIDDEHDDLEPDEPDHDDDLADDDDASEPLVTIEIVGLSLYTHHGVEAAERFIRNTTLPIIAPSLGGIETLITRPATTSHSGLSPKDRQRLGISDSLIRVSVGIEATEDLIEDFEQALKA